MIIGIGNDIIEIERIEKAISKEGFKNKIYTQKELENIQKRGNRTETYAGIFSAKEAISKAIGTGVREFSLTDLEILNDDLGKPYVVVSEKLDKILRNKKENYQIEISISHSRKYATAMAIIL
ncbi:holo-ACP synthase [Fusobacterium nucleatum]|uniref:Holo-[acyl-carrier-protein] synthase n=2 Tax=Fusobacterium nucleatum subsp. nucleatum (strain ATCC 25586 / DSM 15643 / BCRC 10681 / CIP 101130 / JCM 8532 / KCTC 2640 / LMG 13131 / VPI 4355) TaxID=190304 RepID=ACPS_FUSNN|nr:holo-ACP synthase [Fusobacterium nucleatum]Q8RDZ7.1 RecName: Full=Holo-[acyl-carrier-protein] synthase; Short=Holo-ACP synthase; AltName: Full=4'-phosphopantetheinyl transferase AcpS [Fusobacterium nucleatum subsp. nucleatum ATCC 25586]ALF25784.1 4'-phosphopantetheinyl transferase [Fusobacterium nucleatum subsp. nucleatum]AAL95538.1 Holo-[acyl-carrier protein] synthase [Fusobacterium nucleatum subsp. nucleatum ATCC 25586]AVQ15652.1 holo-ACP synthase [Fusobacterium nucleatum subsp. nucleatum 